MIIFSLKQYDAKISITRVVKDFTTCFFRLAIHFITDSIDASTQLTLVNAVYFKGLWQVKFRPEATLAKSFYQYRDAPKMANFMRMRRYFRTDYDSSIDSQVLILPFEVSSLNFLGFIIFRIQYIMF